MGLPISEFAAYNKPMLLADLPYTKETAGGSQQVAFFDPNDAIALAQQMKKLIQGDWTALSPVPQIPIGAPIALDWSSLFQILLAPSTPTK